MSRKTHLAEGQTMDLAIPAEHQDYARAMIADSLRASRECLDCDLGPEDLEACMAEIAEDERRIQCLDTDRVLSGTPEALRELLAFEVRERWSDDADWLDPPVVAWLGHCAGLVHDVLLADPEIARPRSESHGRHTFRL